MFRFRVESHISITFRDLQVSASVGVDSAVLHRSPRSRAGGPRDLAAELEQYTTPAELLDLHAMLDRYDDSETQEIRTILAGQAQARDRHSSGRFLSR